MNIKLISYYNKSISFSNIYDLIKFYYKADIVKIECINTNLTSLEWLKGYTELIDLDCSNNSLISLNGLENCTKLEYLYCYNNKLKSLNVLQKCTQLIKLNCSENLLQSLSGLENCTKLISLDCMNNQLTSLDGLYNCIKLKSLYCKGNELELLDGLNNCTKLIELSCTNNSLSSLYSLKKCINLKKLRCYNNPLLTSLIGLENCEKLKLLIIDDRENLRLEGLSPTLFMDTEYYDDNDDDKGFNLGTISLDGRYTNTFSNLFLNEYNRSLFNEYSNLRNIVNIPINYQQFLRLPTQRQHIEYIDTCPICTIDITLHDDPTTLVKHIDEPCNYIFHKNCLIQWLNINPTCPICKKDIRIINI